jgi:hypothetical protein
MPLQGTMLATTPTWRWPCLQRRPVGRHSGGEPGTIERVECDKMEVLIVERMLRRAVWASCRAVTVAGPWDTLTVCRLHDCE